MTEQAREASFAPVERNKRTQERQENITKIDISSASSEEVANILLKLDPNSISKEYLIDLIGYSAFTKLRNDWGVRMRYDEKGEDTFEYEENLARILVEKSTSAKDDPATRLSHKLDSVFHHEGIRENIMGKAISAKQWLSKNIMRNS